MRKTTLTGLLAAMAVMAAAIVGLLLPSAASAATSSSVVEAASTAACVPYPPGSSAASIAVSASEVNPGESITVTGKGFVKGAAITLFLYPKANPSDKATVASLHADSTGAFSTSITMPLDAVGNQIISVNGSASCPADPVQVSVIGPAPTSASSGSGQPPAVTGTDIGLMVAVAAILVGAGAVFTRGGRRRRAAAHH
ncbi:hypothetical protein [Jatrophihabitans sp.]|uniref:hypothetical protein n=1 Tax=Jatrophihabitans sp. TaxID=1932789 RepID=UPI0030C75AFF|nr:hypothetical protein [Jatrophihabitans sp.]